MMTLKNISSVFSYKNRIWEYLLKSVYSQISAENQCSFIFNRFESVGCTCIWLCSSKNWERNIGIHWNRMKISKCITAQLKSSNKSLLLASVYFWELWVTEQIKSDSFAASWWSVQEQLKSGEKLCLPLHRRFSGIIWHSFGKHFTWNGLAIENSQHVCYCFFCHHTDGLDCGRSNVRGYDDIIQV